MSDNESVIIDRRVKEVLEALKSGKSREAVAKNYDYTNYRSLDQYMRRRNFHWSSENEIYEPVEIEPEVTQKSTTSITNGKVLRILAKFDTEYPDPKKIAEEMNFDNYDELTTYMLEKNYRWDSKKRNYVKSKEPIQSNVDENVDEDVDVDIIRTDKDEFIDYLYDNRKVLKRVLTSNLQGTDLPNYMVTGETSTKTIYMSTQLAALMKEYSNEKNISQRQIVESALIEFLKHYGYSKAIKKLLNQ